MLLENNALESFQTTVYIFAVIVGKVSNKYLLYRLIII